MRVMKTARFSAKKSWELQSRATFVWYDKPHRTLSAVTCDKQETPLGLLCFWQVIPTNKFTTNSVVDVVRTASVKTVILPTPTSNNWTNRMCQRAV